MQKKLFFLLLAFPLIMIGCSKPAESSNATTKAVSDGSEDLVIDYQVNLSMDDPASHFNWKGNVRYMAAEDKADTVSGASTEGSTHLFMMYLYDVEGKPTMSTGLRGLFLFGVNPHAQAIHDNLNASKMDDGSIVVQFVHRGTAYRFTTDSKGVLSLPDGSIEYRSIGTPQELKSEFSTDGTAAGVDFDKVWSTGVKKEGPSPEAMYFWDGDLKFTLEGDILTINGVLTSVEQ
ncbi:hypothetical protein [Spirochaeta cellobiosiphila]|uniref:hypothetical protein n=1 Tax=Spirochaeta cellobiosiphila TaxID=504483 RepID=UPI00049071BC|nr:hypothetical protein [Spirochaeta cellobiosiphila]